MLTLGVHGMPFSDRLLLQFLQSKADHRGELHLLSAEIERDTGLSNSTVYRAMNRLEIAGLIVRRASIGRSYIYKVVNHEQQSA